jgi:hypothetical protein
MAEKDLRSSLESRPFHLLSFLQILLWKLSLLRVSILPGVLAKYEISTVGFTRQNIFQPSVRSLVFLSALASFITGKGSASLHRTGYKSVSFLLPRTMFGLLTSRDGGITLAIIAFGPLPFGMSSVRRYWRSPSPIRLIFLF